jgi:hypothetical protein
MWLGPRLRLSLAAFGILPMEEMPSSEPGKEALSDHSPLWVDLEVPCAP